MKKRTKIIIISIFIAILSLIFAICLISKSIVVTKRATHIVEAKKDEVPEEINPVEIPTQNASAPIEQPQFRQPQEEYISSTEEVYWNVWKSNLFNRFLTDINNEGHVPPTFSAHIEFDVTKNREIKNCYMGAEPKEFEKLFTASVVRILKSYQYTDVLTFPKNTKRTQKHVTLLLRPNFENRDVYTTPEQFSKDTEYIQTIKRKF